MKKVLIFSALFLLASVSLSAQVVKGAGLWYFNGLPNVTPSVATGTEIAYSINNKSLFKWNRTTSAWVVVVQDSSITNELQDLILSNDTLSLTLSDSIVLMAQYRNHVWEIANLSDTTSVTAPIEGDIAYTSTGDTIAFRGATAWLPFTGGGGGGTFNSFNIAGDTGSDIITDGQTVTVAGGYGINTAETGGTVTVTADTTQLATQSDISGFGTMSSFTVAGGSGTPQTITNGNTLIMSEGYGINTLAAATDNVRTEVDTTQIATQNDISGLPSGTGTNQRIVVWTGTNSQGNSTQLQSAAGVTLDANLAYRITGGTTASRPTGAAGMMYWNTSNTWFDFHNGTAWFNPLRSATATGLGTDGRVFSATAAGLAQASGTLHWKNSTLSVGTTTAQNARGVYASGIVRGTQGLYIGAAAAGSAPWIFPYSTAASSGDSLGQNLTLYSYSQGVPHAFAIIGAIVTATSGTGGALYVGKTFQPPSGTASWAALDIMTGRSIIQTGGATGITRGVYVNPGLTNVFDYRGVETTNNVGKAFYQGGSSAINNFAGNVNIGSILAPNRTLQVTGEVRITDLTTDAPTQIVGADADGDLGAVTLGTGLSFSSGTLNGAFLPLTLTGATEVNTAGNILRIRDAADYPEMYMNGTYWLAASSALNYIDVGSDLDTTKIVTDRAIILNTNGNIDAIGDTLNIDANGGYGHVRMTGNLGIGDITNGDGITIAAYAAGNILTSVTIDGTGNSGLLFDDGALTLSNNISEVADTVTRTLGTGQQIYANGYAAYSGSGFTYSSGRITNGSGASRLCKIRYYFTAETAGLLTDALTVRVMIWDGATYNEHRPGRLTMTLNDDWELTGAKETIITLPDGDGVNIAFDSTDGLDVSNFGYVIEKI